MSRNRESTTPEMWVQLRGKNAPNTATHMPVTSPMSDIKRQSTMGGGAHLPSHRTNPGIASHFADLLAMSLRSGPLQYKHFRVSFPDERVVQVTIDRQPKLNCIDKATSREIAEIWERFDQDETLWVGIITGAGRAFCTGADLHGRPPLMNLPPRFWCGELALI
jgi:hypothetical protein